MPSTDQSSNASFGGATASLGEGKMHKVAKASALQRCGSRSETFVKKLLGEIDVKIDGPNSWDIQVHDTRLYDRLVAGGSLAFGESYMAGAWDCRALDELFYRVVDARLDRKVPRNIGTVLLNLNARVRNLQDPNKVWRAADVHYDLPVKIFEATFDSRLTGSCGYWATANDLDAAQDAKLDLICRKLGLQSARGKRVLDIGCGWGAFMGFAAQRYGVNCVGVTVSKEQVKYASERYKRLPVDFRLQDYREFDEPVDYIASMGMFEHVGPKNYRTYFERARHCLKEDGLFVLHTIWANDPAVHIDPWLDKYIFPNGVLPTLDQITKAAEGLFVVEDVHNFGAYYDRTLMAWNEKFQSHRPMLEVDLGKSFCRMWEYYLLCCAGGFRSRGISVGQLVLSPRGVRGVYHAER